MLTLTAAIAQAVHDGATEAVDPGLQALAQASALDTRCAQLVGDQFPVTGRTRMFLDRFGGSPEGGAAPDRAWHNSIRATAAHLDDYAPFSPAGALIWPVLQELDSGGSPSSALQQAAFGCGLRVATALAAAGGYSETDRGFVSAGTFGVLAATAAGTCVRGFDLDGTTRALSIAASGMGGLIGNLDSDAETLQVGHAARTAVRAVLLAERGIAGAPDILHARQGFAEAFFDSPFSPTVPGLQQELINVDGPSELIAFRRRPGRPEHQDAVAALGAMLQAAALAPADVQSVVLDALPSSSTAIGQRRPETPEEAWGSLYFSLALTLLDSPDSLGPYLDGYAASQIADAIGRIRVEVMSRWDARLSGPHPQRPLLTITSRDRVHQQGVVRPDRLSPEHVPDKWLAFAVEQRGAGRDGLADGIIAEVQSAASINVRS